MTQRLAAAKSAEQKLAVQCQTEIDRLTYDLYSLMVEEIAHVQGLE